MIATNIVTVCLICADHCLIATSGFVPIVSAAGQRIECFPGNIQYRYLRLRNSGGHSDTLGESNSVCTVIIKLLDDLGI